MERVQEVIKMMAPRLAQGKQRNTLRMVRKYTRAEDKPTEVKTHAEVAVQTTDIPNDDLISNSTTIVLEGNQETTTNMIRESPTRKTPY